MASSVVLVSAVLLVLYNCITVCTSHDSDLVVLTTADRLREEIRSQLDEALEESLPELCNGYSQNYGSAAQSSLASDDIISAIIRELNNTVTDLISPLLSQLSHLMTPGLTSSHPATSCMEILEMAPDSPSGLYWIRGTDNGAGQCCSTAKHMYCDMELQRCSWRLDESGFY